MPIAPVGDEARLPDGSPVPLSAAYRAGDLLFVSGQLPFDAEGNLKAGDITEQTALCLANMAHVLDHAGLSRTDVVKVTIWLTDAADFPEFNRAYAAFFGDHRPARSTVRSDLVLPGARIEIEAIAAFATDAG